MAPKYQSIADSLRERLADGEFAAGRLLPSEAELSGHYAASRMTVRRALELLRDEGLRPLRVDPHHAAPCVGRPERPVGLGEDALRPLEVSPDARDRRPVDAPALERVRAHAANR